VLTFGDGQGEDEDHSLSHLDHGGFHSKLPPGILPHGLPTVKEVAPAITPQEQKGKDDVKIGKLFIYLFIFLLQINNFSNNLQLKNCLKNRSK
jgi:hypothetical protein